MFSFTFNICFQINSLGGPSQVTQLITASSQYANVVGLIPIRAHTKATSECFKKWNNK